MPKELAIINGTQGYIVISVDDLLYINESHDIVTHEFKYSTLVLIKEIGHTMLTSSDTAKQIYEKIHKTRYSTP